MARARTAYARTHAGPQQPTGPNPKPSLAPMNITVTSGRSERATAAAWRGQSSRKGLESPVEMWSSKRTAPPDDRRRERRKSSTIWIIESPAARTRRWGMRPTCRTWGRPGPCRVRSTSRHAPLRQKRRETVVRALPRASPTRRHVPGRPGGRAQNRAAKPPEPQVSRTRRRVTVVARTVVAPSSAEKLRRRCRSSAWRGGGPPGRRYRAWAGRERASPPAP